MDRSDPFFVSKVKLRSLVTSSRVYSFVKVPVYVCKRVIKSGALFLLICLRSLLVLGAARDVRLENVPLLQLLECPIRWKMESGH